MDLICMIDVEIDGTSNPKKRVFRKFYVHSERRLSPFWSLKCEVSRSLTQNYCICSERDGVFNVALILQVFFVPCWLTSLEAILWRNPFLFFFLFLPHRQFKCANVFFSEFHQRGANLGVVDVS